MFYFSTHVSGLRSLLNVAYSLLVEFFLLLCRERVLVGQQLLTFYFRKRDQSFLGFLSVSSALIVFWSLWPRMKHCQILFFNSVITYSFSSDFLLTILGAYSCFRNFFFCFSNIKSHPSLFFSTDDRFFSIDVGFDFCLVFSFVSYEYVDSVVVFFPYVEVVQLLKQLSFEGYFNWHQEGRWPRYQAMVLSFEGDNYCGLRCLTWKIGSFMMPLIRDFGAMFDNFELSKDYQLSLRTDDDATSRKNTEFFSLLSAKNELSLFQRCCGFY